MQHDTNNILLDAVLTDTGRQFLARNDGSFSINKFALSDDELDYSIISKYGRTVGKEKIEKNTPVFEALTNQAYAQKYKLISISNPNLIRLPELSLSSGGVNDVVSLGSVKTTSVNLNIEQIVTSDTSIDVELRDQTFVIELSSLFLQISRSAPDNVDGQQRATYILTRAPAENAQHGSTLQFTLAVKSLTDALFQVYGAATSKTVITTYVRITGAQSGAVKEIRVNITKNA